MKFGRLPRARTAAVPHLSAILAGRPALPAPASVHYMSALPDDTGALGNASIGDCTCAAVYHALQLWAANTGDALPAITTEDAIPAESCRSLHRL